jgi:hypothetical protein
MNARSILSRTAGMYLLSAGVALASVGRVAVVEGNATKTAKDGSPRRLFTGSALEEGDTVEVKQGNFSCVLNDGSVVMLGKGSKLMLVEAKFDQSQRKAFSGNLRFGRLWAKVSKSVLGAKFIVTTERAEAGVKGTIFRVDTAKLMNALAPSEVRTVVSVVEGRVAVKALVRPSKGSSARQVNLPRHPVSGPHEVSAKAWERHFTELKALQQIEIGEELWNERPYDPGADQDDFSRFVRQHQQGH